MRKAFLHIGMPKTGTTAIQMALSQSRKTLQVNGLIYPGCEDDHTILLALYHQKAVEHYFFGIRGIGAAAAVDQARSLMVGFLHPATAEDADILLSTEYMHDADDISLRALDDDLAEGGIELNVVCYVRHPFSMAASSIQQNVKMGHRLLADQLKSPDWHSQTKALGTSLKVLGRDRIIVRRFEDARELGAERDILQAIGYRGPLDQIARVKVNESLSMAGVALADAHNRLAKAGQFVHADRSYYFKVGGPKFSLPPRSIEAIRKKAAVEVAWLQKHFGVLLEEPVLQFPGAGRLSEEVATDLVKLILSAEWRNKAPSDAAQAAVEPGNHAHQATETGPAFEAGEAQT